MPANFVSSSALTGRQPAQTSSHRAASRLEAGRRTRERPHHLVAGVPSGSDREGLAALVAAAMIPESSLPVCRSLFNFERCPYPAAQLCGTFRRRRGRSAAGARLRRHPPILPGATVALAKSGRRGRRCRGWVAGAGHGRRGGRRPAATTTTVPGDHLPVSRSCTRDHRQPPVFRMNRGYCRRRSGGFTVVNFVGCSTRPQRFVVRLLRPGARLAAMHGRLVLRTPAQVSVRETAVVAFRETTARLRGSRLCVPTPADPAPQGLAPREACLGQRSRMPA